MRNALPIGLSPITTAGLLAPPHAIFLGHDGLARSTAETDILPISFGAGHVSAPLDMIGTLGTALSANEGWLTLTGASDHCYSATLLSLPALAALYHSGGALLMFAQFNADMTNGANSTPCAISIGDGHGVTGKAVIRLALDRANKKIRLQLKGSDVTSVETINGAAGDAFSDDTDEGMSLYLDFTDNTYAAFHRGTLNKTDTSTQTVGSFAEAFSAEAAAASRLTVGGGFANGAYAAATLWEGMARRAGIIGFSEPLSDVEALMAKLHARSYLPYGLFRGLA